MYAVKNLNYQILKIILSRYMRCLVKSKSDFFEANHKSHAEFFPVYDECVRTNCIKVLLAIFIAVAYWEMGF